MWGETTPVGSLRHVFFGLPADVEAAHFLYDLIGVTFDTETARFKTGTIYASLGKRRAPPPGKLSNELRGDFGPDADRRPARPWPVDPAETRFSYGSGLLPTEPCVRR